jgi:Uma2 family endonuclease
MGQPLARLSLAEFLEWEDGQEERHEFVLGETYAMVGGLRTHGRVVMNLSRHLGNALDGTRCEVYAESMQLQVEQNICYPDVFVTCDPRDLTTERVFVAPTLIIEVLSPSTGNYDRGLKFALYRRLDSLKEYVLIDPEARRIESFRRTDTDTGEWLFRDMSDDAAMVLASVGCEVAVGDVFAGVAVPDTP